MFYRRRRRHDGRDSLGVPDRLPALHGAPHRNVLPRINAEAFCATFGKENLEKLSRLLRATTIDDPVIDMEMEATVGDELRWFHVLARALWSGPSDPVYLGSIGKLIDVDDRQAELIDLQFKAYHDPLTEVVNGAFARKIIAERLGSGEACDRHRDRHVLALCDRRIRRSRASTETNPTSRLSPKG